MPEEKKLYYSLSEVSKMVQLPRSTILFWDKKFDQLDLRRDNHGNRYFTEENIGVLKRIKFIRDELHITRLEAIRNELDNDIKQTDYKQQIFNIVKQIRDEIVEMRKLIK